MQSCPSNRRAVRAWILYDWANSAFATTIMAAVLPTFYSSVAAAGLLTPVQASSRWGFTQTIGMLLVALTAPALGAIADYSGSKKRFLAAFAIPGILATALMVFLTTGSWLLGIAALHRGRNRLFRLVDLLRFAAAARGQGRTRSTWSRPRATRWGIWAAASCWRSTSSGS